MSSLEQTLNDVKGLYKDKFGISVQEDIVEEDGIKFSVTRGVSPSMFSLEQSLNDVKGLFSDKFGHSIQEEVVEEDGIKFSVTRGATPTLSSLEQGLNEVKVLCEDIFGQHGEVQAKSDLNRQAQRLMQYQARRNAQEEKLIADREMFTFTEGHSVVSIGMAPLTSDLGLWAKRRVEAEKPEVYTFTEDHMVVSIGMAPLTSDLGLLAKELVAAEKPSKLGLFSRCLHDPRSR
jgi:hypothetical protein